MVFKMIHVLVIFTIGFMIVVKDLYLFGVGFILRYGKLAILYSLTIIINAVGLLSPMIGNGL